MKNKSIMPTLDLAFKLIEQQFPECASLIIADVEKQGHDNRTYRLGRHMLIRIPINADYALNRRAFSVHILSFRYLFVSFPRRRESRNPSIYELSSFSAQHWTRTSLSTFLLFQPQNLHFYPLHLRLHRRLGRKVRGSPFFCTHHFLENEKLRCNRDSKF